MARDTHPREDMLRDARALSPRVKLQIVAGDKRVEAFAGFRGDSLSLYFGEDPVYHFNAQRQLRRAYVDGRLIRAERGSLVALQRQRTTHESSLIGGRMAETDEQRLLDEVDRRLAELRAALFDGRVVVEGEEPPGGEAIERLRAWLATHAATSIAASPRVS